MTQLSLEVIQQRHQELLKLNENAEISEADITQVEEFLKNLAAAGAYIEDPDQRSLLRAYIRYWANFLGDKTGSFPPTQLQPFSITGLQAGGGTENVAENLKKPGTRQDSSFDLSPAPRRSYLNFFRKLSRLSLLVAALAFIIIIIIIIIVFFSFRLPQPSAFKCPTSHQVSAWMNVGVSQVPSERCAFTIDGNGAHLSGVICTNQLGGTTIEYTPVSEPKTIVVRTCDGSQLPDIWGLTIRFVSGYPPGDASVCTIARNERNNHPQSWKVLPNC